MINGRIYFRPCVGGGGLASLTEAGSGVRARRTAARQRRTNKIRITDEDTVKKKLFPARYSRSLTAYPARGESGIFNTHGRPNMPNLMHTRGHTDIRSEKTQDKYKEIVEKARKNLEQLEGSEPSLFRAHRNDPQVKAARHKVNWLETWNSRASEPSPEMSDEEKAFRLRRHQRKKAEKSPGGSKLRRERKYDEREFHKVHGWETGHLRRNELSGERNNRAASDPSPEEPSGQNSFPKEPEKPSETRPRPGISGKHAVGAALAVTGITGAALAARHIYKKRKARKEAAKKPSSSARERIK